MSVQRCLPPSASSAWQSYTSGCHFIQRPVRQVFGGLLGIPAATPQSGKGADRDISLRRAVMINRAASFRFVRSWAVFERLGPSSPTPRSDIRRLLVVDRRRVASAARLPGSTERVEIVFMPGALARVMVNEGSAPRVFRDVFPLQIGPVPAGDPGRTRNQGKQTLLRRRIGPDIQLVDIEHPGYALDRLVGDLFFGGFELPERGGCDKSDQQPEDGEHDEKLEQGEASLPSAPILGEVDRITPERWGPQVRPPSGRPTNQTKSEDHRVMWLVE